MTLRTVLLSLQALLAAAEPDDPQDAVVARQFKESPSIFRATAMHWTAIYANGNYKTETEFVVLFLSWDRGVSIFYYLTLFQILQVHIRIWSLSSVFTVFQIWGLTKLLRVLLSQILVGIFNEQLKSILAKLLTWR